MKQNKLITSVKFGEYLPDLPEYNNPGSPYVSNVLWVNGAYRQAPSFSAITSSLPARPQGGIACEDSNGATHIYVGTTSDLYEFDGSTFTSLASGFTAQDGQYWKFCEFSSASQGNLVLATDFNDDVQEMTVGGASFVALSTIVTSGTLPKASQIANVNQFVVLGDTNDGVTHNPYRVQWCAIGNITKWDYGTLAAQQQQSGSQILNAIYGPITHIADGYQFGLIFQQRGITRMYYTGDDAIFYFDTFEKQRGCMFPNSPVQIGNIVYFWSADGICMTDGQSVTQIGHGKVDTTILNNVEQSYADRVRGCIDPINKVIEWCYCSSGTTTGICDSVLTYNYAEDKFTPTTQSLSMLFSSKSFGYTMETLDNVNIDLDQITPSLDDPFWEGGNIQIQAFDASFNYGQLGGAALTATLDTMEAVPFPGALTFVSGIRPIVTSGSGTPVITSSSLTRYLETDNYSTSSATSPNSSTGICPLRATGRYIRGRVTITGGFGAANGCDIYGSTAGTR